MRNKQRERYTKEELIDALQLMERARGRVSEREFCERMEISLSMIDRKFRNWSGMRAAAGLDTSRMPLAPRIDSNELLDRLRCEIRDRGEITQTEFCRVAGISESTIARRFGSWGRLRRILGLSIPRQGTGNGHTPDELREMFRRALKKFGRTMTQDQFCHDAGISLPVIRRCFGAWSTLRKEFGLGMNRARNKYTCEQLLAELDRVYMKLGYFPIHKEIDRHAIYSSTTYYKRFGRVWRVEAALATYRLVKEYERRKRIVVKTTDDHYTRRLEPVDDWVLSDGRPHRPIRRKPGRRRRCAML